MTSSAPCPPEGTNTACLPVCSCCFFSNVTALSTRPFKNSFVLHDTGHDGVSLDAVLLDIVVTLYDEYNSDDDSDSDETADHKNRILPCIMMFLS